MKIPIRVIRNWYLGHQSKNPNLPWVRAFEKAYSYLSDSEDKEDEEDVVMPSNFDVLLPDNWPQYINRRKMVENGIDARLVNIFSLFKLRSINVSPAISS